MRPVAQTGYVHLSVDSEASQLHTYLFLFRPIFD